MEEVFYITKRDFGKIKQACVAEENENFIRLVTTVRKIPKNRIDTEEWFDGRLWFFTNAIAEEFLKQARYRRDFAEEYYLLGRLQSDCKYAIDENSITHLWGKTVEEHINQMYLLYDVLPADGKPKNLDKQKIAEYHEQLLKINK